MRRRCATFVLVGLLLTACTTTTTDAPAAPQPEPMPSPSPSPSPSATVVATSSPSPSPTAPPRTSEPRFDTWVVGAKALPRRPDGFGEIRPTPPQLRNRLLPTVDLLPPPKDSRYHATISPVTRKLARETDLAWRPGCPVGLADLRYLELAYWGFDGRPHTGQMVVNARVADDIVGVFGKLHAARFPLEQMRLATQQDLDAPPTGDGNVTGAYACRPTRGATSWSQHAYGLAIDINPFNNPYVKGDLVLPELASAYLDRSWRRPGMIHRGDVVTRAFADIGWAWGGDYRSLKDYQHFSATGG